MGKTNKLSGVRVNYDNEGDGPVVLGVEGFVQVYARFRNTSGRTLSGWIKTVRANDTFVCLLNGCRCVLKRNNVGRWSTTNGEWTIEEDVDQWQLDDYCDQLRKALCVINLRKAGN
jgi:hypothetical protein